MIRALLDDDGDGDVVLVVRMVNERSAYKIDCLRVSGGPSDRRPGERRHLMRSCMA